MKIKGTGKVKSGRVTRNEVGMVRTPPDRVWILFEIKRGITKGFSARGCIDIIQFMY